MTLSSQKRLEDQKMHAVYRNETDNLAENRRILRYPDLSSI